jgi:hypothetical protein
MRLRGNFLLSVGMLVVLNVLLAFGAIGLLARMSPAIERILQENVSSNEAAEAMLVLLAQPTRAAMTETRRERFEAALQRARNNVTDPEEVPVLERVAQQYNAALAGEDSAVAAVVQALQQLIAINRQAMVMADREAQRLGTAGAWVAVVIAVVSFAISLMVIRRLERYVLNPLIELYDVLDAVHAGNRHRRCRVGEAPEEIRRVLSAVNGLLDRSHHSSDSSPQRQADAPTAVERGALLHLLEQQPGAMMLVDNRGAVVAANSRGLEVLGGVEGLQIKQLLGQLASASFHDARITPIALPGRAGWLCVVSA